MKFPHLTAQKVNLFSSRSVFYYDDTDSLTGGSAVVARQARGGALSRAPRPVVVVLALPGAMLITPAPVAPLGVMAIVAQILLSVSACVFF